MIDREKVIERLERVSYYFKSMLAVGWQGDADIYREHRESVNMAIALLKEQPKWIPVEDKLLKEQEAERSDWISVNERMPVELHSIFWPWYGKKEWNNAMWREQSDKVLVTVAFKDGTRFVTTGETHDGVWHTAISRTLDPIVTHWMPMPEPPWREGAKE